MKLPHAVIVRAPGLLPMLYKPSELARDLGAPARSVRSWISKGMPHQRDKRGHLWIDGKQFAQWVSSRHKPRARLRLKADEAYCLRCRKPAKLVNPTSTRQGKRLLLRGTCPRCGGATSRGRRLGQSA